MKPLPLDRLAIVSLTGSQADPLMEQLKQDGFNFTLMHATESIITESDICLLVGFRSERTSDLLALVREKCRPYRRYISTQGFLPGDVGTQPVVEAELGGAQIRMMDVERFEQI